MDKPINCKKCGRVLFKINEIDPVLKDFELTVRCKCGADQKIKIKVERNIEIELL